MTVVGVRRFHLGWRQLEENYPDAFQHQSMVLSTISKAGQKPLTIVLIFKGRVHNHQSSFVVSILQRSMEPFHPYALKNPGVPTWKRGVTAKASIVI